MIVEYEKKNDSQTVMRYYCCRVDLYINPFQNRPFFTCLQYKSFVNTVGKGEIALNEQFHLFTQCFIPVWRTVGLFI